MVDEVKEILGEKKVVLFGSYSWAEGEWMDNWKADADEAGVNVVDSAICFDAPIDEGEAACRALEPSWLNTPRADKAESRQYAYVS